MLYLELHVEVRRDVAQRERSRPPKPVSKLDVIQGKRIVAVDRVWDDPGQLGPMRAVSAELCESRRELFDGPRLGQRAQRNVDVPLLADPLENLHGRKGGATQIEEIVLDADLFEAEHIGPNRYQA